MSLRYRTQHHPASQHTSTLHKASLPGPSGGDWRQMPHDSRSRLTPPPVCPPSQVLIWNLDVGEPVKMIDCHSDVILCMSFNTDGSLLTTTCKDKKLRVIEPRSGRILQVKPTCF